MRGKFALMAGCALIAMSGAAYADCAEDLAALEQSSEAGGEVAKDGSLAPLQESESAGGAASAAGDTTAAGSGETSAGGGQAPGSAEAEGEIVKDGSVAPLEGEAGGASEDVAMSAQDAQAQQEGGETAMAAAEQGGAGATEFASRDEALQGARDALAAGDEDACLRAVEAAKTL